MHSLAAIEMSEYGIVSDMLQTALTFSTFLDQYFSIKTAALIKTFIYAPIKWRNKSCIVKFYKKYDTRLLVIFFTEFNNAALYIEF